MGPSPSLTPQTQQVLLRWLPKPQGYRVVKDTGLQWKTTPYTYIGCYSGSRVNTVKVTARVHRSGGVAARGSVVSTTGNTSGDGLRFELVQVYQQPTPK